MLMSTFPRGTLGGSHQPVKCVLLTISLACDHLTPDTRVCKAEEHH
jgi:hypothetical protein